MLDGVFHSGNGRVCGLTTAGGVDDPQQLSAGGASAPLLQPAGSKVKAIADE